MHDEDDSRDGSDRIAQGAVRYVAVRVSHRRMFSDLTDAERDDLVETAVEAWAFAWGPPGRPDDVEAWLALGMYHAMMAGFRQRRMLRRPARIGESTSLDALLEEWLSTEHLQVGGAMPAVDQALTDRFLRQLSPADARLLWMRCEGYTREEIADLLGIRANAVSVRLRRLQLRLRESLELVSDTTPVQEAGDGLAHGVA